MSSSAEFADQVLATARLLAAVPEPAALEHLTDTDAMVLRYVDRHPDDSPTQAADALGLQRSNVSAAIRRLVAREMLERTPDATDRRCVRLRTTHHAARQIATLQVHWDEVLADSVGEGLDERDVQSCLAVLRAVELRLHARAYAEPTVQ